MNFQSRFLVTVLAAELVGGLGQIRSLQKGPEEPPLPTVHITTPAAEETQYRAPKNLSEDLGARLMGRPGKVPVAKTPDTAESLMEKHDAFLTAFAEPLRAGLKFDARAAAELGREGFKDIQITAGPASLSNVVTCTNVAGFVYPTGLMHQGIGFQAEAPDGSKVAGTVCFGIAKKPLPVITKTLRGPMA